MSRAIIPEVVKKDLINSFTKPNQNFNLYLNKTVDNKKISNIHSTYNTTNNTTINNNNKGFFRFLLEIAFLPFILVYKGLKYVYVKYDLKYKWDMERKQTKLIKLRNKYMKKTKSIYDLDEIY